MYKKEENDTMTDNLMISDNFYHDQLIDNSHRNYCLNFVDPNQIAQKLHLLFNQSKYSEIAKEIEINFPEFIKLRVDVHFRLFKYQLYELITKDITSAKLHYSKKMINLIRPFGHLFEKINSNINKLLENPNFLKSRIFMKKLEENKQKFLNNLLREITNQYTNSLFTNSHFDFCHRDRLKIDLCESPKHDFDIDFENEILSQILFQTKKDDADKSQHFNNNIVSQNNHKHTIGATMNKTSQTNNGYMEIDAMSVHLNKPNEENISIYSNSTNAFTSKPLGVKFIIEKNAKNKEKIKKKIPFLKEFNPKFTKRENIDKKILRKFKKYLKDYYKSNKTEFDQLENKEFWIIFLNGNLFPPMKFLQKDLSRTIEFKSFNTQYMAWIFSHKSSNRLYEMFLKHKGEDLYNSIIKKFNIDSDSRDNIETLSQLKCYVFNIAEIFSFVNNNPTNSSHNSALDSLKTLSNNPSVNEDFSRREMHDTLMTENCIEMPAALPNSKGFVFDQLENDDIRIYDEDQILFYNDLNPCNSLSSDEELFSDSINFNDSSAQTFENENKRETTFKSYE